MPSTANQGWRIYWNSDRPAGFENARFIGGTAAEELPIGLLISSQRRTT